MASAIGLASILPASAQAPYPNHPIRIVVPFGPGGLADITVRLLAQKPTERTAAQVVIENRPGAGGIVAATSVMASPPDGYTLFVFSSGVALSKSLLKSMPFDPVAAFAPISTMALFDLLLLVKAGSPIHTFKDALETAPRSANIRRRHHQSRQHPERHRRALALDDRHPHDHRAAPDVGGRADLAAARRHPDRYRFLCCAEVGDRLKKYPRRRLLRQQALSLAA
jgi:tripartite-type tricarboxylate transporter receptor subunit TctC